MKLNDHPTVKWYRKQDQETENSFRQSINAKWLKELCWEEGASDVGLISISNSDISENEKQALLELLPTVKSVISLSFQLNPEALKTRVHSITNLEYSLAFRDANDTCRRIVRRLQRDCIRALNTAAGFPFEADRWPKKMWLISDKKMAERAGLGKMGWNRLVLHPQHGASVVLSNILIDQEMTAYDAPLQYNPCLECKLCVAACPTGAIGKDGHFNFVSCYTHNYREKLGGFVNWIEILADSKSADDYRRKVGDNETISMWQNLSIVSQTRCDRCVAVCPAGEDNIAQFLSDRKNYKAQTVKWMQANVETVYVVKDSDAESYVREKYPHKYVNLVGNGLRPDSIGAFLSRLPVLFQKNQAGILDANYHFIFTGKEPCEVNVRIKDKEIKVDQGLSGTPDLHLIADSETWLRVLAKKEKLWLAILRKKIHIKGPLKLIQAFAKCFPS
jgi:epoxyqueuosine reductase QueG